MELDPYPLTKVAAVVVLALSVGLVIVLGGPATAAPYIAFIGSIAIPATLAVFRSEKNAETQVANHAENTEKLNALAEALKRK